MKSKCTLYSFLGTGSMTSFIVMQHSTSRPHDFKAHGNHNRTAIDHGDGYIQIRKKTYAFDNAATGYLGRLSLVTVKTAASYEKRAQDKTTVRRSEFMVRSDGLSLLQTAQPDNVLAVATTPYAATMPIHWIQSAFKTQGRVGVVTATDDTRAKPTYDGPRTNNAFGVVDQTLKRVYLTPTAADGVNLLNHRYEFDSIGRLTQHTNELKNFTANIAFDRLNRLTDATAVEAHTAAACCDDLGATTNRTSNPGLSDVSAYYMTAKKN